MDISRSAKFIIQLFCLAGMLLAIDNNLIARDFIYRLPHQVKKNQVPVENMDIQKLQIRVMTTTDSDSPKPLIIWVQMNSNDKMQLLKTSHPKSSGNETDTFTIYSRHIDKVEDIQFLKLVLQSASMSDLKKIEILVNGQSIYQKNCTDKLDGQNTLNYKSTVLIDSAALRKHTNWK